MFTMETAGLVAAVRPMFPFTKEYCRSYLTGKAPEVQIAVTPEDLAQEQRLLEQEAVEEGLRIRKFPDPFLERSCIQRRIADCLVERNTLMMHGSTVSVDGSAYLFTAPCGTGKSTHTRLWRELLEDRAMMVNDDKPFLQITSDGVLAYGSPWSGKHGLATNVCVPLKGICLLRRGSENIIVPGEARKLADFLYRQVHMPADEPAARKVISLVDQVLEMVPLWEMSCNKEPEAAWVSFSAMHQTEEYDAGIKEKNLL